MREIGEIIRTIRKRREDLGYSLGDLSRLTGISKSSLSRYESGERSTLRLEDLPALAAGLQMTVIELLGESGGDPPGKNSDCLTADLRDAIRQQCGGHTWAESEALEKVIIELFVGLGLTVQSARSILVSTDRHICSWTRCQRSSMGRDG